MEQQTEPAVQQPVAQSMAQPNVVAQPFVEETPIWKKWWLWVIVAVVIIGGVYFLLR